LLFEDAARGILRIQKCLRGQRHIFPHRAVCPRCGHGELESVPAQGAGQVYSFTIIHRAAHPSLASRTPYAVALVDLDEGVRVIGNVIGSPVDAIRIGSTVAVTYEAITPDFTVPQFTLTDPPGETSFTGVECTSCHAVLIQDFERCPICQAVNSLAQRSVSQSGRLYSYSIIRAAPRGFTAPYVIAYVDLPEGPRVFGHLDLDASAQADLDQPVEVYRGPIGQGTDGEPMIGVRFRLVDSARGAR
jgi:uncharacterized OB-fold protein